MGDQNKLLKNLEFTLFTLVDRVEFQDNQEANDEPFVTKENYVGRFMVSRDVYREQKNFIRINRVEDSYSRLPFSNSKEYKRVDFQRDETVTGVPAIETRKVISHDEKKQWEVKNVKLLCNLQFYLSDDFVLHNRNLYSWLDLIEDFGGFYQMFIIAIFVILGSNINK